MTKLRLFMGSQFATPKYGKEPVCKLQFEALFPLVEDYLHSLLAHTEQTGVIRTRHCLAFSRIGSLIKYSRNILQKRLMRMEIRLIART
jgi:hypothetical protein